MTSFSLSGGGAAFSIASYENQRDLRFRGDEQQTALPRATATEARWIDVRPVRPISWRINTSSGVPRIGGK